jgi:hypothetical protein
VPRPDGEHLPIRRRSVLFILVTDSQQNGSLPRHESDRVALFCGSILRYYPLRFGEASCSLSMGWIK